MKQVVSKVTVDFFSMPAPRPSKRPQVGGSSLATGASSTSEESQNVESDFEIPDGLFWAYFHKFESVDSNGNFTCTCKLCNKHFQKLNGVQARFHLLKSNGKGAAICTKITDAQRRLLPGGAIVTTQAHVDNLFMPTLANDADKAIATWKLNVFWHDYRRVACHYSSEVRTVTHRV